MYTIDLLTFSQRNCHNAATSETTLKHEAPRETKMKHLSPAEYVIHKFGGVRATARAVGRTPGSVSRWQNNGGHVPSKAARTILQIARAKKMDLNANDIAFGRSV